MSVLALLVVLAFVFAVVAATGKVPLWISVFLLALVELLRAWPLR